MDPSNRKKIILSIKDVSSIFDSIQNEEINHWQSSVNDLLIFWFSLLSSSYLPSPLSDYHVFRSGELEELVEEAATEMFGGNQKELTVERQAGGWEKGNWWGIWQVIQEGE